MSAPAAAQTSSSQKQGEINNQLATVQTNVPPYILTFSRAEPGEVTLLSSVPSWFGI